MAIDRRRVRLDADGRVLRSVVMLFTFAIAGCSGSIATYPVSGTVKLSNGDPLPGGRILFQPTSEGAQAARAIIADDGTFHLGTIEPSDGAIPGDYKVVITPSIPEKALDDPTAIARYRSMVDLRYQNLETTPLGLTVKNDGSSNHFDIILEPSRAARR